MRFLHKDRSASQSNLGLRYPTDRTKIREELIFLQKGFCAYSERYLRPLDSVEIEHFDPRLKNTSADNYFNWHAVIRWMNAHKSNRIENLNPLPVPIKWTSDRVSYSRGEFVCADDDSETRNLIEFLGVNKPEVFDERARHVARLRHLESISSQQQLLEVLEISPEELSFPSALEAELGIPAFAMIEALSQTESEKMFSAAFH